MDQAHTLAESGVKISIDPIPEEGEDVELPNNTSAKISEANQYTFTPTRGGGGLGGNQQFGKDLLTIKPYVGTGRVEIMAV